MPESLSVVPRDEALHFHELCSICKIREYFPLEKTNHMVGSGM